MFTEHVQRLYDFSFIGTIHSDRAKILNTLRIYFESQHYSYFFYCYVQSLLLFLFRFIFDKNFRKIKSFVHLEPLSKKKISEIYRGSEYIIDINHPYQTGLTMRTIELVGLQRKFLTTNETIKDYDFYNAENQLVMERKNFDKLSEISRNSYKKIPDEVYMKYSLPSWIHDIFTWETPSVSR